MTPKSAERKLPRSLLLTNNGLIWLLSGIFILSLFVLSSFMRASHNIEEKPAIVRALDSPTIHPKIKACVNGAKRQAEF